MNKALGRTSNLCQRLHGRGTAEGWQRDPGGPDFPREEYEENKSTTRMHLPIPSLASAQNQTCTRGA